MAFTITTIRRAVFFNGVSSAYRAQLPPLSDVWQSVQFKLKEAAKKPMVPKNWSTDIPRSTWIFLKASSAICGFCSVAAWPRAHPVANRHTASVPTAQRIAPPDPNLMSPPSFSVLPEHPSSRQPNRLGFVVFAPALPRPDALLQDNFSSSGSTLYTPPPFTRNLRPKFNAHFTSQTTRKQERWKRCRPFALVMRFD